jgi:SAM-dependent methyltransferase
VTGADRYTHGHAEPVLQSHRWRTAENSAAYLLPALGKGVDLLDVGCGPGTITVDLAARVAPGRVLGIDVSDEPLAEARGLAERSGVDVTFEVGDVYALAEPDDSFDVVHAHQVLQHLTDPVAALREMARVCRPGGVIAVRDVDYAALAWFPEDAGLDAWLDLYQRVHRRNGSEPNAGRRLLSWAHAAGLRDVVATTSSWCFASPEDREWWGTSWAGRATGSSFAEQAVEYGLATTEDLADIATAWLRWAAADDGWLGMLHGELLIRV